MCFLCAYFNFSEDLHRKLRHLFIYCLIPIMKRSVKLGSALGPQGNLYCTRPPFREIGTGLPGASQVESVRLREGAVSRRVIQQGWSARRQGTNMKYNTTRFSSSWMSIAASVDSPLAVYFLLIVSGH